VLGADELGHLGGQGGGAGGVDHRRRELAIVDLRGHAVGLRGQADDLEDARSTRARVSAARRAR
jgi:hypothetical protein